MGLHVFENPEGGQYGWKMVGKEKAKMMLATLWAEQNPSNSKCCYRWLSARTDIITDMCSKLNKFIVELINLKVVILCLSPVDTTTVPIFFHIQFPKRKLTNKDSKQLQNGKEKLELVLLQEPYICK